MRSMPMNTRIDIVVADPARPFVFNLYHYRREAAARGITRMDADGTLRVDLAPVPAVQ
ncbi:hypothetical protein L665_01125 [Ralstonia solanacearum SD54]|uniref:Uncharacterized protein n=3 Tax=Ralstonia TaxID=48736 RepID=A0A0S4WPI4_RALSL|nr:hypothetical protein L665_01125 [Ralstonia solanacearum SD54]CUV53214.1 conserved protein of unknown function [Ralstonia solanacearum]